MALRNALRGSGPVLVLLHEMGATLESWDGVVALLPGRTLLRHASRGAGMSQKISCPVLTLAGATDQTRPASVVREVTARIPQARLVEIASGHVMPMLTPALVARHLDAFLCEVGQPADACDTVSSAEPAKLV